MSDGGAGEPLYSAFLSYSHHDRARAERLQRRIETFRLPRRLVRSGAPARLKPVFRDRDELSAASDLSEALQRALDRSARLIVLCSPDAARSQWVGREIDYFRVRRPAAGVLAALFEGTSANAFHPAMLARPGGADAHPLAADFRRGGDGRLALLKLIAPLARVGLDELVQRDAQRRMHRLAAAAAIVVLAAMVAAGLIVTAVRQRAAADFERARGSEAMGFQLKELRARLEAAGQLGALATVNKGVLRFYGGQEIDQLPVRAQIQLADVQQKQAGDDEQRGALAAAGREAMAAWKITGRLLAADPTNPDILFAHAQSEYYVGRVAWRRNDPAVAQARFQNYAALARQLLTIDPANADWRLEQAYADSGLGMLALREALDATRARGYFVAAQAAFVAVSARRPADLDLRYEIADGEAWLADVERIGGDYPAALAHRRAQRRILDALLRAAPGNVPYRVDLVANMLGTARIAAAQGNYASALGQLDAAHADAATLAVIAPDNKAIARQLRAIDVFKVQTWLAMPTRARPPTAVIEATLGDCAAEWRKPENEELARFCNFEAARLALGRGRRAAAARLLASEPMEAVAARTQLTERWRLNLSEDARRMRATLHGVS